MTHRRQSKTITALAIGGSVAALVIGLYQWIELYRMRVTGTLPSCAIGEQIDCARVWDSALSTSLHSITGIPFAAWGVAWGLICLALAAQSRLSYEPAIAARQWLGLRVIATLGALGTLGLLAYSIALGVFCPTCLAFYVAVWLVTFAAWRGPVTTTVAPTAAFAETGFIAVIVCALVWYPASKTPLPVTTLPAIAQAAKPTAAAPAASGETPARLRELLDNARPELKQALSDTLNMYRTAPTVTVPTLVPRITLGPSAAPVRIVEWVDLMCPHCKNLHFALKEIAQDIPPVAWRLETRYYPLDSECNTQMSRTDGSGVRCLGAKMLICLTGDPREPEVRDALFENQAQLTRDKIWELATHGQTERRAALEKCIGSDQAASALAADIAAADRYGIRGTPLVVVNDRVAPALPVLLYVLILTGGDPDHPALAALPPPNPPPPPE